ncbi:MAG: hypothetical protein ACM3PP_00305 [Candidatus Saccharibacteria bacterium]
MAGFISGKISDHLVTSASFSAKVDCTGIPEGSLSGNMQFNVEGEEISATFSADFVEVAVLVKSGQVQAVNAVFEFVKIVYSAGPASTDCTAVVSGTRIGSSSWSGTLVFICPDGTTLQFGGIWSGIIQVDQTRVCQQPL